MHYISHVRLNRHSSALRIPNSASVTWSTSGKSIPQWVFECLSMNPEALFARLKAYDRCSVGYMGLFTS